MCKVEIKKIFTLSILFNLLLIALVALLPAQPPGSVYAITQPVFHPGYGVATIDGVIDPNEWATADSLSLPMQYADTPLTGTFYVMQTSTDLYLGFTIDDDEYTQDPVGKYAIYGDMIDIGFDDNNNGVLYEIGENMLSVYSYDPWFSDRHYYNITGSNQTDINDGGMANGEGYSTRHNGMNHFELRFPLCSSDIYHDFCLLSGDTVGFRILYYDAFLAPGFDYDLMAYPGTVDWDSLVLIDIGSGDPTPTFQDVPLAHWAHPWIERLYNASITSGCSVNPLLYCPESSVLRSEMAIFLERGMNFPNKTYTPPPAIGTVFGDVPATAFAADWIEQLFADGITSGCGGGNYCPGDPVTRAQMAIFLLRAKYGAQYTPPDVGQNTGFNDVGPGDFAAAWIKQLALEGITTGCGGGNYCPNASVTRAQMAVFLVRTFGLP